MKTVLLIPVLFLLVFAGKAQWVQSNGPYGGPVNCIAIKDNNIFAGTTNGVYLSNNSGNSWHAVDSGFYFGITIVSLATMDSAGQNGEPLVFAGALSGLYVSANNGSTWTSLGFPDTTIYAILISGNNIFITVASNIAGIYQGEGIYLSTDKGAHWRAVNNGLAYHDVRALAVKDSFFFAGTNGGGMFYSSDAGSSWAPDRTGMGYGWVTGITVKDSVVFASLNGTLYRSSDNGVNWVSNTVFSNSNIIVHSLASSNLPGVTGVYIGTDSGVFVSHNYGASWQRHNAGLIAAPVLSITTSNGFVYAGTHDGVYRSADGGVNWVETDSGLRNPLINVLIADSAYQPGGKPSILAGSNMAGIYQSIDNGGNWKNANLTRGAVCFAIDRSDICVGANGVYYESNNNAGSWQLAAAGGSNCLAVMDTTLIGSGSSGVAESNDLGFTWTGHGPGTMLSVLVKDGNIFEGCELNIYRSANKGVTWVEADSGISNPYTRALAACDSGIYAATTSGTFFSSNNGQNWIPLDSPSIVADGYCFAVIDSNVFEGGRGLYFSSNWGKNWKYIDMGLPTTPWIESLLINDTILFAGSSGYGLLQASIYDFIARPGNPSSVIAPAAINMFKVYPNPTSNNFIIEATAVGEKILQVFDISGKRVIQQSINKYQTIVDASSLSSGMYTVYVKSYNGVFAQKLVILK